MYLFGFCDGYCHIDENENEKFENQNILFEVLTKMIIGQKIMGRLVLKLYT